eukprot:TRINITY_DN6296_c0_g1_i2.p1 TRINITY_DN6296_c0_g1~~TRINITY_DN6296_c0_g1_i2.p1  ORF type:complete len:408 (-),score=71.26 TRINITY_DN6296_c0_g1_i2:55-1278(-)
MFLSSLERYLRYHVTTNSKKTLGLISLWMVSLLIGEIFIFPMMIGSCSYPGNKSEEKVILIGDPQLTDYYSYSYAPRGSILLSIIQFFSDIYMRKSYRIVQRYHDPDLVIFLGDLFDGGKILNDNEFEDEYQRWNWVFQKRGQFQVWNLSGNHDIGYRLKDKEFDQNRIASRFEKYFGPRNFVKKFGNFQFVAISALTLEKDATTKSLFDESIGFLHNLNATVLNPSILLSHVPLFRPPNSYCGGDNVRGSITDRIGHSYTNLLPEKLTNQILKIIAPQLVFSGDDHDNCKYHHNLYTTEYTVGTFSWMQGMIVPSFAMLSLGESKASVNICFMPSQMRIYLFYGFLLLLSLYSILPLKDVAVIMRQNKKELKIGEIKKRWMDAGVDFLKIVSFVLPVYTFLLWTAT